VPIVDSQLEVVTWLARLEALEVEEPDGGKRRHRFASKGVGLMWSPSERFLVAVAPAPGYDTLPARLRPSRKRPLTLDTAQARDAVEVWRAWAPGPASRETSDTEQIQEIPLTGRWAAAGRALKVDYLSDKFNRERKIVAYRHRFEDPPDVEVMQGRGFRVWVLRGGGLRVTARGIEG